MLSFAPGPACRPLLSSSGLATFVNIDTEASLMPPGTGRIAAAMTLPAGYWRPGRRILFRAWGYYSTKASGPGSLTLRLKLGTTVLAAATGSDVTAALSNRMWEAYASIHCLTAGATGTLAAWGRVFRFTTATAQHVAELRNPASETVPVTIDTTAAHVFGFTGQFSLADPANAVTCTSLEMMDLL